MEPDETTTITGRIVAEFEDDASQFLEGEPEFVRVSEPPMATPPTPDAPPNVVAPAKP